MNNYPDNYPNEVIALEKHYLNFGYLEHDAVTLAWRDYRNFQAGKLVYSDIENIIKRTQKVQNYATDIVFHNYDNKEQVRVQKDKSGLCSEIIVHKPKIASNPASSNIIYTPEQIYKKWL